MARTTWHIAAALAVPLLVLTACTDASTPGLETTSPATPTPSATPSPTPSPRDEAVAAATQAYEHYIAERNEFAQAGYPAEDQPQLRLIIAGEYSEEMLDNWQGSREHGLRQEGQVVVASAQPIEVNDDLDRIQLQVCEDLSEYDIVDESGASLLPGDRAEAIVSAVTMRYEEDRYQGEDYWLVSSREVDEEEAC